MSFGTKNHLSVDMIKRVSFLSSTYPFAFGDSDKSAKSPIQPFGTFVTVTGDVSDPLVKETPR